MLPKKKKLQWWKASVVAGDLQPAERVKESGHDQAPPEPQQRQKTLTPTKEGLDQFLRFFFFLTVKPENYITWAEFVGLMNLCWWGLNNFAKEGVTAEMLTSLMGTHSPTPTESPRAPWLESWELLCSKQVRGDLRAAITPQPCALVRKLRRRGGKKDKQWKGNIFASNAGNSFVCTASITSPVK